MWPKMARTYAIVGYFNRLYVMRHVSAAVSNSSDGYLRELHALLTAVCTTNVTRVCFLFNFGYIRIQQSCAGRDEDESPECTPVFWISKWVDYSDKYGIGYQLSDNSVSSQIYVLQ